MYAAQGLSFDLAPSQDYLSAIDQLNAVKSTFSTVNFRQSKGIESY